MLHFKSMEEWGEPSLIMNGASVIIQLDSQLRDNARRGQEMEEYKGFSDQGRILCMKDLECYHHRLFNCIFNNETISLGHI